MAQSFGSGQASTVTQASGATLVCRPDRAGNRLVFPYTVTNNGTSDLYVMDAVPWGDRQAGLDRNAVTIWLGNDGFAHILRGIPPLPEDRDVYGHVIPLAAKVPPGETLERVVEVPLPLAESSPYYPDLPLREYQLTDIQGAVLTVEFLRATAEGFRAEPGEDGLFRVAAKDTFGQVERLSSAFPSRQLQILKRPDNFPRPD